MIHFYFWQNQTHLISLCITIIMCSSPFELMNEAKRLTKSEGVQIKDQTYTEEMLLILEIRESLLATFLSEAERIHQLEISILD